MKLTPVSEKVYLDDDLLQECHDYGWYLGTECPFHTKVLEGGFDIFYCSRGYDVCEMFVWRKKRGRNEKVCFNCQQERKRIRFHERKCDSTKQS